jgi:hypothetical protein
MATIREQLSALNEADLSKLEGRARALRKQIEDALKAKGENPNRTVTDEEIKKAAEQAGITAEEFIRLLEWASKVT